MEKEQVDQLYHLLRQLSNEAADPSTTVDKLSQLTISEEAAAIKGLINHLDKSNYPQLLSFSAVYGIKYILPAVAEIIKQNDVQVNRFLDVGCGNGWLGINLSLRFNKSHVLIDKRRHRFDTIPLNLETPKDMEAFKSMLEDYDVITMCDFLHCVDDPKYILDSIPNNNIVVIEYIPSEESYMDSYKTQLTRYGASSFTHEELCDILYPRVLDIIDADPYEIFLLCEGE
jgi:hypothetical protein